MVPRGTLRGSGSRYIEGMASGHFADRLGAAMERTGTFACVGLDPVAEKLPAELQSQKGAPGIAKFCEGVLKAVAGVVPVVKFQSACFERYGAAGVQALAEGIAQAKALGLLVILDAKRGDIGISAEHYAASAFETMGADALTVSPYLGPDTLAPYLSPDRGLFVLVRTSNPGSDAVQHLPLRDGRTVAEAMADMVTGLGAPLVNARGISSVGAVVGATKKADGVAMRARMPDAVFLVPGYGAQGGTADDVRAMIRPGNTHSLLEKGVLVTASRSVVYPNWSAGGDWSGDIRRAAERLVGELAQISG